MSRQSIQAHHDRLVAEYPFKDQLIAPLDRIEVFQDADDWCEANCQDKFRWEPATSTWREGGPGWIIPIRFASDRDATLFKMFHA